MVLFLGDYMLYRNLDRREETFQSILSKVLPLYVQDYGEEKKDTIIQRFKDTIFILEGTPLDRKKAKSIKTLRERIEYLDYICLYKKYLRIAQEEFKRYIELNYHLIPDSNSAKLWDIDFSPSCLEESKRGEYFLVCLSCGLEPITNNDQIYLISQYKKNIQQKMNIELIKNSLWGKRIHSLAPDLTSFQLEEILFDTVIAASTCVVETPTRMVKACYIPLDKLVDSPSLDRIVFHELRHVVETTETKSGLSVFANPQYDLLNEVRTEYNAMNDEKNLSLIFSRNNHKKQSKYERILDLIPDFSVFSIFLNHAAMCDELTSEQEKEVSELSKRIKEEEKRIIGCSYEKK